MTKEEIIEKLKSISNSLSYSDYKNLSKDLKEICKELELKL